MAIDKRVLLDDLIAQADAEAATLLRAARATHEGATHPEAKPENDKDTRSVEAAYLVTGQAARVRELSRTTQLLRALQVRAFAEDAPIAVGAIVRLESDGGTLTCLVCSAGGGMRSKACGEVVSVVTPESPLGQALLEKTAGDEIELVAGKGKRVYEIVSVE